MMIVGEKFSNGRLGISLVFRADDDFHTVAGRKNHPLGDPRTVNEIRDRRPQARFDNIHSLPDFHGRRPMIHSDQKKVHNESQNSVRSRSKLGESLIPDS